MNYIKQIAFISLSMLIVTCSLFTKPDENNEDPIESIINSVNIDSLTNYVNILSGEIPVIIYNQEEQITSRHSEHDGNVTAGKYLYTKLNEYNLTVSNQYNESARNIIATQTGREHPDQIYIICAHYDCYPDSSIAPGADDNASGTAAVIEAARIISQFETTYTIVYALWDEEEQGLLGSIYYAALANAKNVNILGVINIDMIGWDSDNDRTILINTRTEPNSIPISDKALYVIEEYGLGLNPEIVLPGSGSDNLVFWYFGFNAIGIEEHWAIDWNDHYHTTEDQIDNFNIPYFHEASKLAIGTIAELAEIL
ncbi:M28 family metallopeptidase [Candidatus Neomarinimicrobiota bacterium]